MVDVMVAEYRRRRDVLVDGLNAIPGFSCRKPAGAFYVFPNIRGTGMNSSELADLILEKAGVALLPGSSFGEHGEGFLRLSYATSLENIRKGLDKIQTVMKDATHQRRQEHETNQSFARIPAKMMPGSL
jgi:aspartate aminotransferase